MKQFILASLFFSVSFAHAGQFDFVYEAMAIPTNAVQTNNSWNDLKKIKGVKWQWGLNQIADHDYTMQGTIPKMRYNRLSSPLAIEVSGMRSMIQEIKLTLNTSFDIEGDDAGFFEKDGFFKNVTLTPIKTKCDVPYSAMESSDYFKVTKKGYKPLFLNYGHSNGNKSGQTFAKLNYKLDCD